MKKRVKDIWYDTDVAFPVGPTVTYGKGLSKWSARLYMTPKTKRYFLCGHGGLMSVFSSPIDFDIVPISDLKADRFKESFVPKSDR